MALSTTALVASVAALFIRMAPAARHEYLYNADLLYLPSLFTDIAHGGSLIDWHFSNAPYLFPDIALFLPIWALAPNMFVAIAIFGAAQLLLLAGGFSWLASRSACSPLAAALALVCGAAFCAAVDRYGETYRLAIASVFHVGLLVVMPFALAVAGGLLTAETRWRRIGLGATLALLTGLTVASDLLYLFQVALPMALTCALMGLRGVVGRRAAGRVLAVVGLSSLAGIAFERLTQPYRGAVTTSLSASGASTALKESLATFPRILGLWLGVALAAFVIAGLWALLRGLRKPEGVRGGGVTRLLALGSVLGGFALMLAVAVLTDKPTDRYVLNVFYIGPFLAWPLLIGPGLAREPRRRLAGLVAAGALALLLDAAPALPNLATAAAYGDYYPPLVSCIDANAARYGLRSGIAQYWQARPVEMLSRRGLHVVTLLPDLLAWHWLSNISWYNREINFAVVDHSQSGAMFGFTARALTGRFGAPAAIISCGTSDIYVYNRPSDAQFRSYLYRTEIEGLLRQPGRAVSLEVAGLRGKVGVTNGAFRSAAPARRATWCSATGCSSMPAATS